MLVYQLFYGIENHFKDIEDECRGLQRINSIENCEMVLSERMEDRKRRRRMGGERVVDREIPEPQELTNKLSNNVIIETMDPAAHTAFLHSSIYQTYFGISSAEVHTYNMHRVLLHDLVDYNTSSSGLRERESERSRGQRLRGKFS